MVRFSFQFLSQKVKNALKIHWKETGEQSTRGITGSTYPTTGGERADKGIETDQSIYPGGAAQLLPSEWMHAMQELPAEQRIDSQTWHDLELGSFREQYNHTKTSFGDQVFDLYLHSIAPDTGELARRQNLIIKLMEDPEAADSLTKDLQKLEKQRRGSIIFDLWLGLGSPPKVIQYVIPTVVTTTALLVLICIFAPHLALLAVLAYMVVHVGIFSLSNTFIGSRAGSIHYLTKGYRFLVKHRKTLAALEISNLDCLKRLRGIGGYSFLFRDGIGSSQSQDPLSLLLDYLRVFLCLEAISYRLTMNYIDKNLPQIRYMIRVLGEIDCGLNSVRIIQEEKASIAEIHSAPGLSFVDMQNPLVTNPVCQTEDVREHLIITGMNMAGKSTFLKSLGINQLLATSFGFAFARRYSTSLRAVLTSLRLTDDLVSGKSKYYVEAERLLYIQQIIGHHPALCLIDEILTGTNTEDRIVASKAILKNFARYPDSIIIAATHDILLASELSQWYSPAYFDGIIEGHRILFDYTLKPGILSRRNGLLVLQYLGIQLDDIGDSDDSGISDVSVDSEDSESRKNPADPAQVITKKETP